MTQRSTNEKSDRARLASRVHRQRAWRHRGLLAIALPWLAIHLAAPVFAQEVQIQVDRGPHYLGEPIVMQIVASGFEEEPAPEVQVPRIAGATLRAAGVSDSSSTSISIVNGKMTRTREVRLLFRYELTADRAGPLELPAFEVVQGTTRRATRPVRLEITRVPRTGLVNLKLEVPEGPLFVGQKVPVEVVMRIDREAQRELVGYDAVVPLFDAEDVRFLDEPPASADSQLEIRTARGNLSLAATARDVDVGGRTVLELRAKRTMIPSRPGELRVEAPRVLIHRGRAFRRDLFGQRQATSIERLMSEGQPLSREVIEVPRPGRPESFAGAVGSGFGLEVSADRSVVQIGEPITLRFLLRGDGDLTTAGLPPFDAEGFFDPAHFRLPEEPPAGWIDADGKHFEASVRVLDAGVREIPALTYSWFDAETRTFETIRSRPIALSVGAAQVIGADDVDRREDPTAPSSSGGGASQRVDRSPDRDAGQGPARSLSMASSGANLAVDDDATRVLGEGSMAADELGTAVGLHAIGLALFGFAAWERRRLGRDPAETARDAALKAAEASLREARRADGREAAAEAGRALRALIAALPDEADDELDRLLADLDAIRFAPEDANLIEVEGLLERAAAFVLGCRTQARPRRGGPA